MDVWYVGYGSNLLRERFLYYILGGQFPLGGSKAQKCSDSSLPTGDRTCIIHHALYFARSASHWKNGGVAFILPDEDESSHTYGRMWKITEEQFLHIRVQEGRTWYDKKIPLGQDENGIPIWTITSTSTLKPNKPSDNYLKTIVAGLKETYHLDNQGIIKYLMNIPGIENNFTEDKLASLCQ